MASTIAPRPSSALFPRLRVTFTDESLPFDPLAGVPQEAQSWLWYGLLQAVEETVWDRAACRPRQAESPGLSVSRPGQPRYDEAWLRTITLAGLRRMLRLEVQLALEALEAWLLAPGSGHAALILLGEHADRIGSLYSAMCRQVGVILALLFLHWELKLLHYRGSEAVAPLAFGVCGAR